MKTNLLSYSKHKRGFTILLLLFSGFFANQAMAQAALAANDVFIWKGVNSSSWIDKDNWTILRGTTTAGSNNFPGEIGTNDVVYVNKSDTPFAAKFGDGQVLDIARLLVSNAFGGEAGATFTIEEGAILNVGNILGQSNHVLLNGGNIVNNGTLNIKAISVGFAGFPVIGINCGNPAVLPSVPTEYGYSGSGSLIIELASANFANAAAIAVLGNNNPVTVNGVTTTAPETTANAIYKFILNNPEITFNQATALSINAIRAGGGNNANKMIIGGTGFTIGTSSSPSIGGLINYGGGSSVTIEAGTTLTLNSAITNLVSAISSFSANTFAANLNNKGTINIQGASNRSGISFATGNKDVASVINLNNDGVININLNIAGSGYSGLGIGNGGGGSANAGSIVNVNNTGTMTLKNTSAALGTGFAIFTVNAGEAPKLVIANSGTLNLEGSTYNYGLKTTVNNTGMINSNSELRAFSAVNNNVGGSINFVKTATTATTRQVSFTVVDADTSGSIGSIYKDGSNNNYVIVAQKYAGAGAIVANTLSSVTVAPTGTLTRVSTGAGSATINYTAVSLPAINNALGNTVNSGTINTGAGSNLNIINALSSTGSTSVFSPGGDADKGLIQFNEVTGDALSLMGTLKMQASGSATAGVDFDAINFTGALDIIDISGATLDLTGIYIPTVKLTLDIITTNTTLASEGAITGSFASVIAPKGWSVNVTEGLGSKVQLVFDPALTTSQFAQAKFSYYPNPTRNQLNISAAKNINKVELYNVLGQNVLTSVVNATQKQVDISTLKTGIYMMEVTIENTKQSFKVVKQ
jgi:hypothetical protein